MNESPIRSFGLTLLDIIACALGAAVVIAVIFSVIKQIPPSLSPDEFIIVETNGRWNTDDDRKKMEHNDYIGFDITSPAGDSYYLIPDKVGLEDVKKVLVTQKQQAHGINIVSARDVDTANQRSYMVITKPQVGTWTIKPYYFDYTQWITGTGQPTKDAAYQLKQLTLNLWTKEGQCAGETIPASAMDVIGNGDKSKSKTRTLFVTVKLKGSTCHKYNNS